MRVDAALHLPGVTEVPECDGPADVVIRLGRVPAQLSGSRPREAGWEEEGSRLLVVIPDIVRLLILDGQEIRLALAPGVAIEDATIFILGTGFGALFRQRNCLILHASSVVIGETAVAFCGPSGTGKSTLAGALVARGHRLVSDDTCWVDVDGRGRTVLRSDGRALRLWEDSLEALGVVERRGERVRSDIAKYYVPPLITAEDADIPLGAIYVLDGEAQSRTPEIAVLSTLTAASALRQNVFRPRLAMTHARERSLFHLISTVLSQVPIFQVGTAREWRRLDDLLDRIERKHITAQ